MLGLYRVYVGFVLGFIQGFHRVYIGFMLGFI